MIVFGISLTHIFSLIVDLDILIRKEPYEGIYSEPHNRYSQYYTEQSQKQS